MKERIENIIKQYVETNIDIDLTTNLITDLDLTSFELATMAADFEEEFGICIETDEMMAIQTVADIVACIQKRL